MVGSLSGREMLPPPLIIIALFLRVFSGRSKPSKYSKWLEKADKEEKRQNLAPKALNSLEFAFAFPANPFTFALLILRKTYGKP